MSTFHKGHAQVSDDWGLRVGLALDVGSHIGRLGAFYNVYWLIENFQINQRTAYYLSFRQLGHGKKGHELQLSIGGLVNWGSQSIANEYFVGLMENNARRPFAAGYGGTWYIDNFGTSQSSGSIALHVYNFHFYTENDILTGTGKDRFRTGGVSALYSYDSLRAGISMVHWTGDPDSKGVVKYDSSHYPSKTGYKDLSKGTYGKYSHGLLSLQGEYAFTTFQSENFQTGRLNIGIDSERIRHVFQNRLMHELISKGRHYPMLDADGLPVTNPKDGDIKPLKPYINLSGNPPLFY